MHFKRASVRARCACSPDTSFGLAKQSRRIIRGREARNCGVQRFWQPLKAPVKGTAMTRKKKSRTTTEFHTVKRLDNTRLVRNVEPVKMRNLYRTVALGGIIAAFFLLYIYQHFKCIDLSFQLEAARTERVEASALNSSLRLEIAGLSNPKRIDMIARRQLGLTETLPSQVREYQSAAGAEVAAAQFIRVNRAQ